MAQLESHLQLKDQQICSMDQQLQAWARHANDVITMNFKEGKKLPRIAHRTSNAVVKGDSIYVHLNSLSHALSFFYTYDSINSEWVKLPDNNRYVSTIVLVAGFVTTVGGCDEDDAVTNQLISLVENKSDYQWLEVFPPMPTKRDCSIAFSYGDLLVVAGGAGERYEYLRTVEVLDISSMQWFDCSPLPEPLSNASTTLCGDNIFILGGWFSADTPTTSVLTCRVEQAHGTPQIHWNHLADLPVLMSTGVSHQEHLLAVGGVDCKNNPVDSVYRYDRTSNSWRVVGRMLRPRGQAFAAMLPSQELLVAGGHTGYNFNKIYEVEIATITMQ